MHRPSVFEGPPLLMDTEPPDREAMEISFKHVSVSVDKTGKRILDDISGHAWYVRGFHNQTHQNNSHIVANPCLGRPCGPIHASPLHFCMLTCFTSPAHPSRHFPELVAHASTTH